MNVSLITVGDPDNVTGGYLYHRRMAEAAPHHGADLSFVSLSVTLPPLATLEGLRKVRQASSADVIVIDSLAARHTGLGLRQVPARVALVAMVHQPPGGIGGSALNHRLRAWLDLIAYRQVQRVLVASETLKKAIEANLVSNCDVVVAPPGKNLLPPTPGVDDDLRESRAIAVLCVANWLPHKGVLDALEATARLSPNAVTLHLVGDEQNDGAYARKVRSRILKPDLRDRVVTHGLVPAGDLAALYRGSDVFLLPSHTESYGTVYAEAMSAGLPVVGYEAGNLPNLAEHGREGLIAPKGRVDILARFLQRLAEDREDRTIMGEAARRKAQSFPTWDQTATRFFDALRETLLARTA
jgi:glycosyltransferase involved in cell wall biosynthesis